MGSVNAYNKNYYDYKSSNYIFFSMSKYDTNQSHTFQNTPDEAYLFIGSSSAGSVTCDGLTISNCIWTFAGEGYWNGAFYRVKPSNSINFYKSTENKAFVLLFW